MLIATAEQTGYRPVSARHAGIWVWTLLGMVSAIAIVGMGARARRDQRRRGLVQGMRGGWRRHPPFQLWLWLRASWAWCLLAGLCLADGFAMGWWQRANLDRFVGLPVEIRATVQSTHGVRGGTSSILQVHAIQLRNGAPPSAWIHTFVRADWLSWGRAPGLTPGTQIVAAGTLMPIPAADRTGKPLRSALAKFGIRYDWSGRVQGGPLPAQSWAGAWHRRLIQWVSIADPSHHGIQPLLDSVLFGGQLPDPTVSQAFLAAGLLHVLAASGANVVLLLAASQWLMRPISRWLAIPDWVRLGMELAGIAVFCALCGGAPAIVRASWMAVYRQVGHSLRRPVALLDAGLFALAAMSTTLPADFGGVSSVLSFAAIAAIALAMPSRRPARRPRSWWLWRWLRPLWTAVRITSAIELAMVPLTVSYFGQITPYGLLSNLVMEPVASVLLPATAAYYALGAVAAVLPPFGWACRASGTVVAALAAGLLYWVRTVSAWPDAVLKVSQVTIGEGLAYGVLAALALVWFRPELRRACYNWAARGMQMRAVVRTRN